MSKRIETKDCVELIRVSTDAQAKDDRGGWDAQRGACASIAEREHLTLRPEWLIEMRGVSGAAVMYSEEMQRLISILKGGGCNGVVMKEISRLMRPDDFTAIALAQIFKENAVKLYTVNATYDLSNPHDQLMFMMQIGMAGYERTTIMTRCTDGRRKLRSKGKCASADHTLPPALTYNREKETWGWDAAEASKVTRLFDLFVSGETNFRVLSRKTGLSYYIIKDTLSNRVYTGVRVYDERREETGKIAYDGAGKPHKQTRKVKLEKPEHVPLPCGGIVSDDVFAHAQQLLKLKGEMRWRRNNESADPFTYRGLLRCAECNSRLISVKHSSGGSTREYYVCKAQYGDRAFNRERNEWGWRTKPGTCRTARIRRDVVEPILDGVISARIGNPEFIFKVLETERRRSNAGDNKHVVSRLNAEIAKSDERLSRLKKLYVKGDLDEQEYESAKTAINADAQAARDELAKLTPFVPKLSLARLVQIAQPFQAWGTLSPAERRTLLLAAVPVFKVAGVGNGGRGAGAHTDVQVRGFYLMLTGEETQQPEDGGGAARKRGTRTVPSNLHLVNDVGHLQKAHITDPMVYIPLSA
jgi:DNA invertase Pin-like site-specific DNA recombinase